MSRSIFAPAFSAAVGAEEPHAVLAVALHPLGRVRAVVAHAGSAASTSLAVLSTCATVASVTVDAEMDGSRQVLAIWTRNAAAGTAC